MNLYGFVGNDPVDSVDNKGQFAAVAGVVVAGVAIVVTIIIHIDNQNDDENCAKEIKDFEEDCKEKTRKERSDCSRKGPGWTFNATTNSKTCGSHSSTPDCGGNCVCN